MNRLAQLSLAAAALLAASPAMAAPIVTATEAWCRAAPAGAPTGACYLTLSASQADRLVGVETPVANRAEIHTMSVTGGVMRMRQLKDGLALPAGVAVALKPGGEHLMIIGPKQPLKAGGVVPLTLRFAKSAPLSLRVRIMAAPAMAMEHQ